MQTKAIEFYTDKARDPMMAKVTITGSFDFAYISWQTSEGALGSALFLEDEIRDPYLLNPAQRHRWVWRMIELDYPHVEIASVMCCSTSLVSKIKREMQQ